MVFLGTMVKKKHEMMRSPYEPAVMGPRIARVFWPQGIKVLLTLGVRHQVSRVTLGLVVMLVIHISWLSYTLPETNSSHLKMDGWNTFSFPFGARPIVRGETGEPGVVCLRGFARQGHGGESWEWCHGPTGSCRRSKNIGVFLVWHILMYTFTPILGEDEFYFDGFDS